MTQAAVKVAQWFDGIYLIGQFNHLQAGCWLLVYNDEGAILEMPPVNFTETSPAICAQLAVKQFALRRIKYLLCTHTHFDHFSRTTLRRMVTAFPQAEICLQAGFRNIVGTMQRVSYFDKLLQLDLGGEPLFLVHAPKHSITDTMVIFRGTACTGDWELDTIRSVHDWTKVWAVPHAQKLAAIARMEQFPAQHNYQIHRTFSVHANDKRENVDFPALMASTREDRQLW